MPSTIAYDRGAVVLLPFPFSDQSATKLRPAVVLNPAYPSSDLLVVAVSSVSGSLRPGEYALQQWRDAGLLHPSFIKRAVATISQSLIRKKLGMLESEDLASLNNSLRIWFGI
jgi:mRNA interferase MazF